MIAIEPKRAKSRRGDIEPNRAMSRRGEQAHVISCILSLLFELLMRPVDGPAEVAKSRLLVRNLRLDSNTSSLRKALEAKNR